jgi:hypothetical protein
MKENRIREGKMREGKIKKNIKLLSAPNEKWWKIKGKKLLGALTGNKGKGKKR